MLGMKIWYVFEFWPGLCTNFPFPPPLDVSWITFSAFVGCLVPCWVTARGPNYDMQQCQYPPVNTGYFKLSSVATTLRQQLVLEISLMSVPSGCGPLLTCINASGLICCIITIWLLILICLKRIKAGILRTCPSLVV